MKTPKPAKPAAAGKPPVEAKPDAKKAKYNPIGHLGAFAHPPKKKGK